MGSSFKDRFANKISVMGKDGRATRIDGSNSSGHEARETQYSRQPTDGVTRRQSPAFSGSASRETKMLSVGRAKKKAGGSSAQQNDSAPQGYAARARARKPVDYQPYTLQDYKNNCQPGKWEKLGCLGPDLQDEELLNKRAQKDRLKDYSEKLRKVNAEAIEDDVFSRPASIKKEPPKPKSKTELAREYAAKVPKPKIKVKKHEEEWDDEVEFAELKPLTHLEQLENRHRQDQAAVESIRKQLGAMR